MNETRASDDWRYLRVAFVVVLAFVVAQVAGWLVYRSVHHGPTALSLTDRCLRREKLLSVGPVRDDPVARSRAWRRARDQGRGERRACRDRDVGRRGGGARRDVPREHGPEVEMRLERRGRSSTCGSRRVAPIPTQRQTMYDCWYE